MVYIDKDHLHLAEAEWRRFMEQLDRLNADLRERASPHLFVPAAPQKRRD